MRAKGQEDAELDTESREGQKSGDYQGSVVQKEWMCQVWLVSHEGVQHDPQVM